MLRMRLQKRMRPRLRAGQKQVAHSLQAPLITKAKIATVKKETADARARRRQEQTKRREEQQERQQLIVLL